MNADGLRFGVYPLSVAGTPFGVATGPADDYERIRQAVSHLRGEKSLSARTYLIYTNSWEAGMLANADTYARHGLLNDVVIGCGDWTDAGDQALEMEHWLDFIRKVIDRHGDVLTSVQITNEPNLSFMEGSKSYVYEALIRGVVTAKHEIERRGLTVDVGFGSVPDSPVAVPDFWETLRERIDPEFLQCVAFVGHNFYVDVFDEEPVPPSDIPAAVDGILSVLRRRMDQVGLPPSVPIRVTENGWPTGKNPMTGRVRSEQQQAKALETLIRAVAAVRSKHGVSHYVLFGLRDADTQQDDLFHHYGILHDDYTPKPGFAVYQRLISELGMAPVQ